jgi:asparagine synthase (glutamine-hydrolysing)
MCGICGKLELSGVRPIDHSLLKRMTDSLHHRGPDDDGFYISGPVGLGHRRLSIIDLSTGKQPITNEDSTIWIVFNGEIYNYLELRQELLSAGHTLKTASDTEVIVHLYEEHGPALLKKLRGMFAFAIWDENEKCLFLARDRVGIKPLYYCQSGDALLFGSEIKAILADPGVQREIDLQIVDRFLTYQYTPGPETLLRGIYKLQPGHFLLAKGGSFSIQEYWDLPFNSRADNHRDYAGELTELLRDTVKGHLLSDVPLGILLSGGVDSTAMLGFASELRSEKIQTFTIGFDAPNVVDERPYARLAAEHFGAEHREITITSKDFETFLPRYVWHMEEPVCEPPAVALYYVSKLAREHVKVLLSGEGGDEAFGGYPEYRRFPQLEKIKSALGPLNGLAGAVAAWVGDHSGSSAFQKYAPLMSLTPEEYYLGRTALPIKRTQDQFLSLYAKEFLSEIDHKKSFVSARNYFSKVHSQPLINQMLYVDTKTWLPDDLLIKADKITMANSVELRVPLLDHRILEFAASLPVSQKVRDGSGKFLLRQVLAGRVPEAILTRKKVGFPVPYADWMRHDLKELVNDTLLSKRATERGYFNRSSIERLLSGNGNGSYAPKLLFSLTVFELWNQCFLDQAPVVLPV